MAACCRGKSQSSASSAPRWWTASASADGEGGEVGSICSRRPRMLASFSASRSPSSPLRHNPAAPLSRRPSAPRWASGSRSVSGSLVVWCRSTPTKRMNRQVAQVAPAASSKSTWRCSFSGSSHQPARSCSESEGGIEWGSERILPEQRHAAVQPAEAARSGERGGHTSGRQARVNPKKSEEMRI